MLPGTQKQSRILLLSAIGLNVISLVIGTMACVDINKLTASPISTLFMLMQIASAVLWFWSFAVHAKGRGYSPWIAAVGILGLIGLIIMMVLPDKTIVKPNLLGNPGQYPQ